MLQRVYRNATTCAIYALSPPNSGGLKTSFSRMPAMAYITETTSSRSGTVSNLLADVFGGIGNLFSLVSRYRDYSKAEAQLLAMTDRQLDDLGVARAEVRSRVWANFARK